MAVTGTRITAPWLIFAVDGQGGWPAILTQWHVICPPPLDSVLLWAIPDMFTLTALHPWPQTGCPDYQTPIPSSLLKGTLMMKQYSILTLENCRHLVVKSCCLTFSKAVKWTISGTRAWQNEQPITSSWLCKVACLQELLRLNWAASILGSGSDKKTGYRGLQAEMLFYVSPTIYWNIISSAWWGWWPLAK